MSCVAFFAGDSPLHRLDPRVRLVTALMLGVVIALSEGLMTLAWALAFALLLAGTARLAVRPLARRVSHLNLFMLFLWCVLPWSVPGRPLGMFAGIPITAEGARLALEITLKGNAIVLVFTALVATIDPAHLGCALKRLALPDKLVHLLVLVIRYTDVIHDESARLRKAMKVRAFRPGFSRHTLRTLGYLVGLLLVRSMERSERVMAAMKCRGFRGEFHAYRQFAFGARDLAFVFIALGVIAALALGEWA